MIYYYGLQYFWSCFSDAIRYSFGPIIQKQLSDLVIEWNHHRIRSSSRADAPGGIPEILYNLPSSSCKVLYIVGCINYKGAVDSKCPLDDALLSDAREEYGYSAAAQDLLVDDTYRVYAATPLLPTMYVSGFER